MNPWLALAQTLAGRGLPLLAERLEKRPGSVAGQIAKAVGASIAAPTQVEELVAADPQAVEKLAALEVQLAELGYEDVQRARETHRGHFMTYVLPLVLIVVWVWMTRSLMLAESPPPHRDLVNMGYGSLTTVMLWSVSYWVGSSRGSAEKQDILSRRL